MNRSGPEAFARLAQQFNRARLQATGGGGGAGGGGGMPGGGKGALAGGGVLIALAGGALALNYSLYNGESSPAIQEQPKRAPDTRSRSHRRLILPSLWLLDYPHLCTMLTPRSGWRSSCDQVYETEWNPTRHLPRGNALCCRFRFLLPSFDPLPYTLHRHLRAGRCQLTRPDPMVRDSYHLRCPSEA